MKDQKKAKTLLLWKKKKHTIKTQVVVDAKTAKILCTNYAKGRRHDFRLYKKSKVRVKPSTNIKVDSGYQGLHNQHANCNLPIKQTKKKPLTREDTHN